MRLRTHVFRRIIATITAVLAASLLLGNVSATAADANTASISGTVTAPAGVALTGVFVNAQPQGTQSTWGYASVAPDGTYRMERLAAGAYKISFSGGANGAETQWYKNAASQATATPVSVTEGQNLTGIDATLIKGASISGKVTLPAGIDATGLQVSATSPESEFGQVATTAVLQDGTYRLAGLAAGTYKLKFSGYNTDAIEQWYNNAETFADAATVTLAKGQDLTGINAALVKGSSISGKVTAPSGTDLTNIRVSAYSGDSLFDDAGNVQVGADGTYRLSGLRAGSYKLQFAGYQSGALTQWYNNADSFSTANAVDVAAGQDVANINATLVKGASISGKVTLPAGVDWRAVHVNVMPTDSQNSFYNSFVQLSSDGTYRAAGLPAGSYKIQFTGFNSGALSQWYKNADSLADATPVTVTAGQDLAGIDATLVKGASISGKITMPAGMDPSRTHVSVFNADSQAGLNIGTSVASDGTYKVAGLNPGSYKLQFSAYGTGALSQWYKDAASFASATPVAVAAGEDVASVDAALAKGASISGTVSAPAGVAVSGVTVSAYLGDARATYAGNTSVGPDGTYRFEGLPAGSYKLQFSGNRSGAVSQWYNNATTFEAAEAVPVTAGQDVTNINVALAKGGSISGKVTVPAGTALTAIYVNAYTAGPQPVYVASTPVAQDGTYSLPGLEAGSYKIGFNGNNSAALPLWYKDAGSMESATPVAVTAGQDLTGIDATLLQGGSISGKVSAPAGISTTQLNVVAYTSGTDSQLAFAASTWVGSDGSYKLVGLPTGSYKLQFSGNSSGAVTQWYNNAPSAEAATAVAVTAGQDVVGINTSLTRGATISGKVTAPAGTDLRSISVNADTADGSATFVANSSVSADGTYSLTGLPQGTYKVRFAGNNSGAVDQWYNNAATSSTANVLTLAAAQDLTGINATMVKGATISGKLTGLAEGEQYPVTVLDAAGKPVKEGYSDNTGAYSVSGLPAGSYKVAFNRSSGFSLAEAQFYQNMPESTGVASASSVAVTAGQSFAGKDGTLVKGGSLSGTVTDKSKAGLSGAKVQAYTRDGSKVTRTATTDAQGKFSVTGLTSGQYLLAVTPPSSKAELGKLYSGSVTAETSAVPATATAGADKPAGDLSYATTTPAPVSDPKAAITLDPAKPAEVVVRMDNTASTVAADYHVIVNGDLSRPKVTVPAGQKSDVVLTGLAAKSTVEVRVYGDGKGTGTRLASATTPDSPPAPTPSFTDVSTGNQFYKEISWLASNGISTGWVAPDGTSTFGPLLPVNRDAMAAFMYRLSGKPAFNPPAVSPFKDVATDNQFYKEITWLASTNITTGWIEADGTRTYAPLQSVNRDAMAAFMYRLAGKPAFSPPAVSPFTDVATDNQFYKEITWLASTNITTGWTAGDGSKTFAPVSAVNRDAMAAFMYRYNAKFPRN